MQRYNGTTVIVQTGAILPGATVTVYETGTLTEAAIFEDAAGATPQDNPFVSSATSAMYSFCAADGTYDLTISKAGYTTYTLSQVTLNGTITTAEVLVATAADGLPDARVVEDTATIMWNFGTPQVATAEVVAGSIGPTQLDATLFVPQYLPFEIDDAAIKTIPTAPVTLAPAPGAGIIRIYLNAWLSGNFSAGAYVAPANSYAVIGYSGGIDISSYILDDSTLTPARTFFTALFGTARNTQVLVPPYTDAIQTDRWGNAAFPEPQTNWVNKPLLLTMSTTGTVNLTGGNIGNTLTGWIAFLDWPVVS